MKNEEGRIKNAEAQSPWCEYGSRDLGRREAGDFSALCILPSAFPRPSDFCFLVSAFCFVLPLSAFFLLPSAFCLRISAFYFLLSAFGARTLAFSL
jgi:hypothetical protein